MKDDSEVREISAGAGALVGVEIGLSIFRALVERGIMTDGQVSDLLSEAAERQRQMDGQANIEAGKVLGLMAKAYAGKFLRGMPVIRPGA